MALNIGSMGATLGPNAAAQLAALARTNVLHYTADGASGDLGGGQLDELGGSGFSAAGLVDGKARAGSVAATKGDSFSSALLKAMDGVSASQGKSDNLLQQIVANPDSVDAQDVTIAMAEANMSLNLAKTILSRIVTAWKDVINIR